VQTSALPDLAHTDTKPVHWLATAAAMAAVVAGAALVQPEAATATATAAEHRTTSQPATAAAPDPSSATYPLDCRGADHTVADHASGDLDGDGTPETVAVVRCAAGSGTPPSGVYVLTQGSGAAPRVVATLVDPAQKTSVTDFTLRDGIVAAKLLGYSSIDIPRCCPDQQENVTWQWKGNAFVRSVRLPAQSA
jgi:streptogramin lyase